jgi:hypothetical protein
MENNKLTSPREWYHNNEEMINSLGFYMCMGDGDNIGLCHDDLNNEIDIYWEEESDIWVISTLFDGEEDLYEEVETEEDVIEILQYVSENTELFNSEEE